MKRLARIAPIVLAGLLAVGLPGQKGSASPTGASLGRSLPELNFNGVSLGDCIDFLRDVSGANINVQWKVLAESNVTKDTPITLRMHGVSLRKALSMILSEAAGGDALTFYTDDNVIEITSKANADKELFVKVYPVDDLLMEVPDFADAPKFDISSNNQQGGGGGGQGGQGSGGRSSSIFGSNGTNGTTDTEKVKTKDQRAQELVDLIVNTIQPDVWKENGGTASVRYYNGNLVVSAPRSVHDLIGGSFD